MMTYHETRALAQSDLQQLYAALETTEFGAYFATPTDDTLLFGIGAIATAKTAQALQGAVVFGAQSFDEQVYPQSELMAGFWFVPEVMVTIATDKITFGSDTVSDFTTWLAQFVPKQPNTVTTSHVTDEVDWIERTENLIDTLAIDQTLAKVVFGRQQTLQLSDTLRLAQIIRALAEQANTYHVVLKRHDELFISATPERLVAMSDGQLATAAVAGTSRRGTDGADDIALGEALLASQKNRIEHQYVVASITTRLQDVATSLKVPATPTLLKNKQVQHLYTPITGDIAAHLSMTAIVDRLHPTPALGGVPREAALYYIATHEKTPRGLFAGPIGYFTADNSGEFVVGIRSMYVNQTQRRATLFAGAGIVADSDAQQEYEETGLKFEPMRQLLKDYNHVE
nr:isochorismate synthase [Leuconostoc lactis]